VNVANDLSAELGKSWSRTIVGEPIEGRVTRRVEMLSGAQALIERSRDFSLVPWRDLLERRIGRSVSGIARDEGINWTFGRGRSRD
jgi:hypothetical protein